MSTLNDLGQPIGNPLPPMELTTPERTPMLGRYCQVVPLEVDAHAHDLHEAFTAATNHGDWTYLPYGPFASLADFKEWLVTVEHQVDPMFFTIIEASSGRAAGVASYMRINPAAGSIEVGHIHLAQGLQRTPAGTEALYLMMRRAFEGGYRRYEWKCDDLNAPSRAAAARLGFVYEGTFRKATHYKGRSRDTAWFSITDDEWPALETKFERWLSPDNFDARGVQRRSLGDNRPHPNS